jgi:hypothetical protein
MAALASWIGKGIGTNGEERGSTLTPAPRATGGRYHLRALPNEDVALWVKQVDNSRVAPQRDPQVRSACWRYISTSALAVALVVGLLLPGAYNWLAGYRMNALNRERQQLVDQQEMLKHDIARIESPAQLELWAQELGLKAPDARRIVYLRPANDHSLAMVSATGAGNR